MKNLHSKVLKQNTPPVFTGGFFFKIFRDLRNMKIWLTLFSATSMLEAFKKMEVVFQNSLLNNTSRKSF
jgi:hypothetical protein